MEEQTPTFTVNDFINDMKAEREHIRTVFEGAIDKIHMKKEEKIIQLLEMIVKQNEEIIKNQNIWRTLPTVPVPPNIDPHFGKDIPYKPYFGPTCE